MKTVWILTRESVQLGRYGKRNFGVKHVDLRKMPM